MVGTVVAHSSARTTVCDGATPEPQERALTHVCLLPWIPIRTTFCFPFNFLAECEAISSLSTPVTMRIGSATQIESGKRANQSAAQKPATPRPARVYPTIEDPTLLALSKDPPQCIDQGTP
jgi:hypothetical protein